MIITLDPILEAALLKKARQEGISPETLALQSLREQFLSDGEPLQPRDEWERQLRALAIDCGVSLTDQSLSREELYD